MRRRFRNLRVGICLVLAILIYVTASFAFQREFREYPAMEYNNFPVPPGGTDPEEFTFGHLMYPDGGGGRRGFFFGRRGGSWRQGYTNWTNDYPRADRHLMVAVNRLTRIQARPAEQPVNLEDDDDVFNWPFLYAVRVTNISLTDEMLDKLREYLDRGGFLITDDVWGAYEHQAVLDTVERLYPDRELIELTDGDAPFHMLFDLKERYQIIGQWGRFDGQPLVAGAYDPHWKGVFDDNHNMVVAVWLNNDTGDSWEWADDPTYPERWSALGIRMALNHIAYAMTH